MRPARGSSSDLRDEQSGFGGQCARDACSVGEVDLVDDAGSRVVREYSGMSVRDTTRTWSVREAIVPVVGLASPVVGG